ncbi:MAG: hypothetical protein EA361_00425 [Bacteroidetes bacterium]|nr:MAG: hypothetical protein EA361_00425 [Bacteroidota bacterium]
MKHSVICIITFVVIGFVSCEKTSNGYKYNQGSLPETPVNLSDFNTEYDDFNSSAPTLGWLIPFCFSTNRNSSGEEFDIIYQPMNVNYDKSSGKLTITNEYANWGIYEEKYEVIKDGLNAIKTTGNEYGPNLLMEYVANEYIFTLLYSTDVGGKSQIRYITNKNSDGFTEPADVEFLKSEFDDMYPTFNLNKNKIYFCSNRDGEGFNIYYVNVNSGKDYQSVLSDSTEYEIFMDTSLSGTSDDKCPFIFRNVMVFASNREGGYGGFDLYYSLWENNKWSEPVNFGPSINTEYDEFRPILIDEGVSETQTMMVFSSDRPGGLGGFDLYFTGIDSN